MSDCDKCVHTYLSGNCVLGCDQTFTIIENKVVNSSLEPDCPHFVLSGRVRDSSDSAKDSNNATMDLDNDIKDSDNTTKDLSDQDTNDNIFTDSYLTDKLGSKFDILRNINLGLFGGCITGAVFFGLNKIPSLDFITFVFCVMFIISAAIYAFDSPENNDHNLDGDE